MKRGYTLLTGATGLLGQYLMRDLLRAGDRLAVVVRGSKSRNPQERLEQILQQFERQAGQLLPRPVCLEGDITRPAMGLSPQDLEWVSDHCEAMFHCAASLTFQEAHGEPWRTNVEGTRHVLDVCHNAAIEHMHYVSTAYVCGRREDLVMEDELDVGQEFRNDYEKSKFLAEQAVVSDPSLRCITVYRPVVITGDSRTGYTSTYHGSYLYMKLASILARNIDPDDHGQRHVPLRWGVIGDTRRNITPVDWNSEVMTQLFHNPAAHGRTYHLAPQEHITMRDVVKYATRFYGLTGIECHGYADQPDFKLNELERWIWSNVKIYGAYDFQDAQFDTTNLRQFAPTPDCPAIDEDMAHRLIRFAEEDRWGKRKAFPAQPAPLNTAQWLRGLVNPSESRRSNGSPAWTLGLDVIGPGGGPWHLTIRGGQLVDVAPGLPQPSDHDGAYQVSSEQLAQLRDEFGDQPGALTELLECLAAVDVPAPHPQTAQLPL